MTNHEFNTAWQAWQQAAQNCQQASQKGFAASLGLAKAIWERHEAWLILCGLNPEFSRTMEAEMSHLDKHLPLSRQRQVEYKTLWAYILSLGYDLEGLQDMPGLSLNMLEMMQSAGLTADEFGDGCIKAAYTSYEDWKAWLAEVSNGKAAIANAAPGLTKFKPYRLEGLEGWQIQNMTVAQLLAEFEIDLDPSLGYQLVLTPQALAIPPEPA
jgi:hypothetical protein